MMVIVVLHKEKVSLFNLSNLTTYLTNNSRVENLESFIKTKLSDTLEWVADESWGPAFHQSLCSFLSHRDFESIDNALVLGRVHLNPALDQIQGDNGSVGDAAAQHATKTTEQVVLGGSKLTTVTR